MASSGGTAGAAYSGSYGSRSGSGSYATVVASHQLARQRSVPAALAAAFASCGRGGEQPPRRPGDGRGRAPPASRPAGGGGVVRALLAWVGRRRRRKAAVMVRSGSSKQQYGHDEYAQNFDEGAAAGEPENLSRSFSARYARRELWRDGAR